MTKAIFAYRGKRCVGFDICGHSGYASEGSDIVCAAISAMTMLTANTITEFFGCNADTVSEDTHISLRVCCNCNSCDELLRSFENELKELSKQYPKNITVLKITAKE